MGIMTQAKVESRHEELKRELNLGEITSNQFDYRIRRLPLKGAQYQLPGW